MMDAVPPTPPTAAISRWRWWVCGMLFLATALNYMDRVALNQMAVRIQTALSLDDQQYSRLESGFSFAFAMGALIAGFIVDRFSVRWMYPAAVIGWSLAGILTGYATSFYWLLACRVGLGLFEAGNWPCGIRATKAVLRPEERSFGNSLFQSGTAIGAILTPLLILELLHWADAAPGRPTLNSWQLPFRFIGMLGIGWILLWFVSVPGSIFDTVKSPPVGRGSRYRDIFRDPRFYALLVVVVAINVTWHTYRTWFPKYLQQRRNFDEEAMTRYTTAFYLAADVGSWTVGLLTLLAIRRGLPGHSARLLACAGCGSLALTSAIVPFAPTGWALSAAVLIFAFASLGLFPTYFAMSQEVSTFHQGKITGTLGASAHLFLSLVVYPLQGWIIKSTGSYDAILGLAGIFPLIALAIVVWLWPPRQGELLVNATAADAPPSA